MDARKSPTMRCITTCSFLQGPSGVDVLSPALGLRQVQDPLPAEVDLSLPRGLVALQMPDGGFDLSAELAAVLGLRSPGIVVDAILGNAVTERLAGALLALKTIATFNSDSWDPVQERICNAASMHCRRCLGISEDKLWHLLGLVEDPAVDLHPFPAEAVVMLRANFGARMLWSGCDMWLPLLPSETRRKLHTAGVICPRNFLVDLATVSRCSDAQSTYFLFRQGGTLFVGTVAEDTYCIDAMRQGRHLEAAAVSFGWLEEDRVLIETTLPNGLLCCYAGAPDALARGAGEPDAVSLTAGNDESYAAAGYELADVLDSSDGSKLRIWQAARAPSATTDFIEVKKTTNLRGSSGECKRAKYWMQASLAMCGGVLVATTANSTDRSTATFSRYTLDELAATVSKPSDMWTDLSRHLDHVMRVTAKRDGDWTLFVNKRRNEPVELVLKRHWRGNAHLHDRSHILRSLDMLNAHSDDAEDGRAHRWEMQSGAHWSAWKPEGLVFHGRPGEVLHFKIAGYDYSVVFGPGVDEGLQENLCTGRRRRLRRITTHDAQTAKPQDHVQQLCDMGFPHADVLRSLRAAHGDTTRAIQSLLSGAGA